MSDSSTYTRSYQEEQKKQLVWDQTIEVFPGRLRHFGPAAGVAFYLVTNEALKRVFRFRGDNEYSNLGVVTLAEGQELQELIETRIPEPAHVLVISPEQFLVSPHPDRIGRRKVIVMPCASTPTRAAAIEHFIRVMERSDPDREVAFTDRFFDLGRASPRLEIVNERHATRAVFEHLDDDYEWNVQAGPLGWGDQQIAPSGELSVCPVSIMEFDPERTLAIDGEIALEGPVAIHNGSPSFYEPDRARLHAALATMQDHPVIVTVERGRIVRIRATDRASEPAAAALRALIELDSRYGVIWECGFGINTSHRPFEGNVGMNEPYGGTGGCSHWGLGLTPHTQYALIILCPGSRVLGKDGVCLIGPPRETAEPETRRAAMRAVKNSACGCYPS